ncbi:hypothetical protein P3T24_005836 [Paraburkholderia sp. GAS33]|uniref:hypothetical protein n=1 Tax=Paraburkholderia sp. GAS33 TaxID=3035130 RepID=UPI003D1D630A
MKTCSNQIGLRETPAPFAAIGNAAMSWTFVPSNFELLFKPKPKFQNLVASAESSAIDAAPSIVVVKSFLKLCKAALPDIPELPEVLLQIIDGLGDVMCPPPCENLSHLLPQPPPCGVYMATIAKDFATKG